MVFPLFAEKFFHLAPQNPPPDTKKNSVWTLNSRVQQNTENAKQATNQSVATATSLIWSLTSTMALGRSSALNSCNMDSIMFFQPSLRMLPCLWARSNTVLAAVCALLLLPNTVGRFSTDCKDKENHTHIDTVVVTQNRILVAYLTSLFCTLLYSCHIIPASWPHNHINIYIH